MATKHMELSVCVCVCVESSVESVWAKNKATFTQSIQRPCIGYIAHYLGRVALMKLWLVVSILYCNLSETFFFQETSL